MKLDTDDLIRPIAARFSAAWRWLRYAPGGLAETARIVACVVVCMFPAIPLAMLFIKLLMLWIVICGRLFS